MKQHHLTISACPADSNPRVSSHMKQVVFRIVNTIAHPPARLKQQSAISNVNCLAMPSQDTESKLMRNVPILSIRQLCEIAAEGAPVVALCSFPVTWRQRQLRYSTVRPSIHSRTWLVCLRTIKLPPSNAQASLALFALSYWSKMPALYLPCRGSVLRSNRFSSSESLVRERR